METEKKAFRFIILIPHRDALKPFDEYRSKLFAKGLNGACSFPSAAPLAEVSRPFSRKELKELACNFRNLTKKNNGRIISSSASFVHSTQACSSGTGNFSFFGLPLNLPAVEGIFPLTACNKIIRALLPPVLCAALVRFGVNAVEENHAAENLSEEAPALSFRAASLANLAIRPLSGTLRGDTVDLDYSFEWKISPPVWLPAYNITK